MLCTLCGIEDKLLAYSSDISVAYKLERASYLPRDETRGDRCVTAQFDVEEKDGCESGKKIPSANRITMLESLR